MGFFSENPGVGFHVLLQEIFPTRVSHIAGRLFTSWATREAFSLYALCLHTHSKNIDWESRILLALLSVQSRIQALCFSVAKFSFSQVKEPVFWFLCLASHKDWLWHSLSRYGPAQPLLSRRLRNSCLEAISPCVWGGGSPSLSDLLPLASAQAASDSWTLQAGFLPLEALRVVGWQEWRLWSQGNLGFAWNSKMSGFEDFAKFPLQALWNSGSSYMKRLIITTL